MRKTYITAVILMFVCAASLFSQSRLEEIRKAIKEKGAGWTAAENWVTELPEEKQKLLLGELPRPQQLAKENLITLKAAADLPDSLDWRKNSGNWVTPVKN